MNFDRYESRPIQVWNRAVAHPEPCPECCRNLLMGTLAGALVALAVLALVGVLRAVLA